MAKKTKEKGNKNKWEMTHKKEKKKQRKTKKQKKT